MRIHRAARRGGMGVLAAVLASAAIALPTVAVPPGWTHPKRVLAERFGPQHAMVVDEYGKAHIVVEGLTSPGIWYITKSTDNSLRLQNQGQVGDLPVQRRQ